jgi:hypothetical protein
MKPNIPILALITASLLCPASLAAEEPMGGWTPLFNGRDLTGWDTYLGAANPTDPTYGINHDPTRCSP